MKTEGKTLFEKLWDAHVVDMESDVGLIYIDRHLVHEVTSPQAFEGLTLANRRLWRPASVLATADHNVPTIDRSGGITDAISKEQVEALTGNCARHKLRYFDVNDTRQGIVHIIGPEQGATLPGMTVVCGDSHTSTHGALAVFAMGIGTSDVEHVLATQCLPVTKLRNMRIEVNGALAPGVSAKDLILAIIGTTGTAGGTGYAVEYCGEAIRALSIEGRMTVCNMTIELGARVGMVAYDDKTEAYVRDKPYSPKGQLLEDAMAQWRGLVSDASAHFDAEVKMDAPSITPQVTWGTSPEMVAGIGERVPAPEDCKDETAATSMRHALKYMGLDAGTPINAIEPDTVFIGSCTNSRLSDLRDAAHIVRGKKIASRIRRALVVPGSGLVKQQAEEEGLAQIFVDAGFEWREPGCSMCLAMNDDRLEPGERSAATSNRNFEGRQGRGGRTHLVSPQMAAAAAIAGHFCDVREML